MVLTDHHEILSQLVFVGKHCYSWPLTNSLVRFQPVQEVRRYREIVPADVEVIVQGLIQDLVDVVIGELKLVGRHERVHAALFEAFRGGDLAHHFVDCVVGIHDKPGRLFLCVGNRCPVNTVRPGLSTIHTGDLLVSVVYFKIILQGYLVSEVQGRSRLLLSLLQIPVLEIVARVRAHTTCSEFVHVAVIRPRSQLHTQIVLFGGRVELALLVHRTRQTALLFPPDRLLRRQLHLVDDFAIDNGELFLKRWKFRY